MAWITPSATATLRMSACSRSRHLDEEARRRLSFFGGLHGSLEALRFHPRGGKGLRVNVQRKSRACTRLSMKPVFTAADLERVPEGGEVVVTQETLITPLARDEAQRRGITFRMVTSPEREASGSVLGAPGGPEETARVVAIGAD